jgi:hypothetical protein
MVAAASPMRSGKTSKMYYCERECGFCDASFEIVEAHELKCDGTPAASQTPKASEKTQAQKSGSLLRGGLFSSGDAEPILFSCDYNCGFKGDFDSVQRHELTCAAADSQSRTVSACACGFTGSAVVVAAHQVACPLRGAPPRPDLSALSDAAREGVELVESRGWRNLQWEKGFSVLHTCAKLGHAAVCAYRCFF